MPILTDHPAAVGVQHVLETAGDVCRGARVDVLDDLLVARQEVQEDDFRDVSPGADTLRPPSELGRVSSFGAIQRDRAVR